MGERKRDLWNATLRELAAPKHLISLNMRLNVNELATVSCVYHPETPAGNIMHGDNADGLLQALAADFVLVPRDMFDTLPEDFRDAVIARVG